VREVFYPPLRTGLIVHGAALLVLLGGSAFCLWSSVQQQVTSNFALLLIASFVLFTPVPLVIYRLYALLRAEYILERDGLRIRWGLRAEDIPMLEIEWVRPAYDLVFDLPLPRMQMPGAIFGAASVPEIGEVEFIAADLHCLVLVATSRKVYAVSPSDPQVFVQAFERAFEMGSLSPFPYRSVLATSFLAGVWKDRWARSLILLGLFFSLLLFLWVSLAIPGRSGISLGFSSTGKPLPLVPPDRLFLLPVLGGFIFITDLVAGFFLYRRAEYRSLAYLVWGSSVISPVLLILAAIFITSL